MRIEKNDAEELREEAFQLLEENEEKFSHLSQQLRDSEREIDRLQSELEVTFEELAVAEQKISVKEDRCMSEFVFPLLPFPFLKFICAKFSCFMLICLKDFVRELCSLDSVLFSFFVHVFKVLDLQSELEKTRENAHDANKEREDLYELVSQLELSVQEEQKDKIEVQRKLELAQNEAKAAEYVERYQSFCFEQESRHVFLM